MGVDNDKTKDKSGLNMPDLNTNNGGEDLETPVSEPYHKAKEQHQTDHNYTVKQADDGGTALDTGRRRLSHRNPNDSENAKKKRDQEQALFRTALQQLQERLNEIFDEIATINERLQEIFMEMEELEYLKDLAEKGLLDPKNPDHAKLIKKYGITQDDLDSGRILLLLNEQLGYRIDERTALEKRRDTLQDQANEAIQEAKADGTITSEEAEAFRNRLQELEAGVSAQVRITQGTSQKLKNIAIDHHSNVFNTEVGSGTLDALDAIRSSSTVADTLNGHASYTKGIQSQGKDIAIKDTFKASANPAQSTQPPEPAKTKILDLGIKNE